MTTIAQPSGRPCATRGLRSSPATRRSCWRLTLLLRLVAEHPQPRCAGRDRAGRGGGVRAGGAAAAAGTVRQATVLALHPERRSAAPHHHRGVAPRRVRGRSSARRSPASRCWCSRCCAPGSSARRSGCPEPEQFRVKAESVTGYRTLAAHFPSGLTEPTAAHHQPDRPGIGTGRGHHRHARCRVLRRNRPFPIGFDAIVGGARRRAGLC